MPGKLEGISTAYSDGVVAALAEHDAAVEKHNAQLTADLGELETKRRAILAAHDATTAPHREAYNAAVAELAEVRDAALEALPANEKPNL